MLQLLASHPGQTLSRAQLLDDLHGSASSFLRRFFTCESTLRSVLELMARSAFW
ncbi:MAG: hypothetical protein ACRDFQ_07930 [Anaerolineales bacterium]